MNLKELRERAWWACDDVVENPQEIPQAIMDQLLNDALRDVSPYLNILTSATPTFTAGVASLPDDFIEPVKVYDDDTLLNEIDDIDDAAENTDTTSQYMIRNNTQIHIHGITPSGTVTIWYNAYATEMDEDTDEPDEVPLRFHKGLAEFYVPWKLAEKIGNEKATYYRGLWLDYCGEVEIATISGRRANSLTIKGEW